ncbi:MAG: inositol monophosphatase [Bdellovibrionales bacterium]|nr:inositol monophosphatase [Bdellovibrionales bacterium]
MRALDPDLRQFVLHTVRRAGDFAMLHWPSGEARRPFEVEEKEDGSPVTTVDIAVNEMLISELSRTFATAGFFTEEAPPTENLESAECVWVIDPIDGTANFVAGRDEFGVLVTLVANGEAIFGASYFPAYNSFLWAERGFGAYMNDAPLRVSERTEIGDGRIYVRGGIPLVNEEFRYASEIGTAHGFFQLCAGEVDGLLVKITQHSEWDFGPWVPIVEESGGRITDESGYPIRFSFQKPTFKAILASNSAVHEQLVRSIVA